MHLAATQRMGVQCGIKLVGYFIILLHSVVPRLVNLKVSALHDCASGLFSRLIVV